MKRNIKHRTANLYDYDDIYVEGSFNQMAADIVYEWDEGDEKVTPYEGSIVRFQMLLDAPDGLPSLYFAKNEKVYVEDAIDAVSQLADFIKECSSLCETGGFPAIDHLEVHPEWRDDGSVFILMFPIGSKGNYGIPNGFTLDASNENF